MIIIDYTIFRSTNDSLPILREMLYNNIGILYLSICEIE